MSYSIKGNILKYVLEDYLGKIGNLTPIQSSRRGLNYSKDFKKKLQNFGQTKILHKKTKFLKSQIIEYSILFIITKYFEVFK